MHVIRFLRVHPAEVDPVLRLEAPVLGLMRNFETYGRPEAFDPDPYLALMDRYGIHHAMVEMEPGAHTPT